MISTRRELYEALIAWCILLFLITYFLDHRKGRK